MTHRTDTVAQYNFFRAWPQVTADGKSNTSWFEYMEEDLPAG